MKGCEKVGNYMRCRQAPPSKFDSRSLRTVSTKTGNKLIIGCPKGEYSAKTKRCKVGTRLQSILKPIKRR